MSTDRLDRIEALLASTIEGLARTESLISDQTLLATISRLPQAERELQFFVAR